MKQRHYNFRRIRPRILITLVLGLLMAQPAAADVIKRSLCVFDPLGANGFVYAGLESYVIQARAWGIDFEMIPYTDEAVAASDFKSGRCDAAALTGIRAIHFVKFAGSLDMAGGLQTYEQERMAIRVVSSPAAAQYMSQDGYEVVGVVPLGKAFLYARDREWLKSPEAMAGHKIAIINADQQAVTLAKTAGLSVVPASIATFGPMFNNGAVDLAYAPAWAYEALELYKGLTNGGGIADFVLGMLSGQILIHKDRFTDEFGQKSRTSVFKHLFDPFVRLVKQGEADIPEEYWYRVNAERTQKYQEMFRTVRQRLWEQNWYAHKMQELLKKVRCKTDPSLAECSMSTEGGPVR